MYVVIFAALYIQHKLKRQ